MTLTGAQFTLGTATAVQIAASHHNPQRVTVHNQEHAESKFIYLGGANVTALTGMHVDPEQTVSLILNPGEDLYALGSHADLEVGVIRQVM